MKRDMELVRSILLSVESAGDQGEAWDVEIPGYSDEQVEHHCWLVWKQGLAKGCDVSHMQSPNPSARLICLTPAGHDFLENARDDTRWKQAVHTVTAAGGSLTVEVLGAVLSRMALKAVGLGP